MERILTPHFHTPMARRTTNAEEQEATRLKTLAESQFQTTKNSKSALKYAKRAQRSAPTLEGISELVSSLNILSAPDFYAVLDVEPDANSTTIRKQYNKLSSLLHPSNNHSHAVSSQEAFKVVTDAFEILSDKTLREDYDGKLDFEMREKGRTFWTACDTCRVLHQFERRYLGNKLVCPGCNKSFKAVEAIQNDGFEEEEEEDETLGDFLLLKKKKKKNTKKKGIGKMGCEKGEIFKGDDEVACEKDVSFEGNGEVGSEKSFKAVEAVQIDGSEEEDDEEDETLGDFVLKKKKKNGKKKNNEKMGCEKSEIFKGDDEVQNDGSEEDEEEDKTLGDFMLKKKMNGKMGCEKGEVFTGDDEVGCEKGVSFEGNGEVGCEKAESFKGDDEVGIVGRLRKRTRSVEEVLESSEPRRVVGNEEETMTLAQFQSKVKRKLHQGKVKGKGKEEKKMEKKLEGSVKRNGLRLERHEDSSGWESEAMVVADSDSVKRKGLRSERHKATSGEELEAMAVADSDFYDFDKDRVERSFKKGQVWAVYDGDDDGMPRQYVLIDETVSANPFKVMISWLDLQNNGDGKIVSREKLGFHTSCGRFKVAKKASISSVNVFSHVVDCDRASREVYKIYPKKGSVWALYSEAGLEAGEGKRCYDIVVFLTSYSEINGISMAYLEKVDGYKTVFKRQESGSHAVRFLGKDEFWLISHQIPARKFPCDEAPELLKDCWELDPASLPSDLLTIGGIDN